MYSHREMALALAFMFTVFAITAAGAWAGNIYVDDDVSYPGGGTIADPYKRITTALAAATYGDTIHVAAGLYDISHNGETFPLTMKSGVSLSGEDRETTILDAEGDDYVSYHVIYCDGVSDLTIEGFTITGGNASQTSGVDCHGGGVCCYPGSSPIIVDNLILDNSAEQQGGGVYSYQSSPVIELNTISRNKATSAGGGGIFCQAGSPVITANTITDNWTGLWGGGVYCAFTDAADVGDNAIAGNSADECGGGVAGFHNLSHAVKNNLIWDNTAASGGALFTSHETSLIVENNEIGQNSARVYGGGICCYADSLAVITSNFILDNSADLTGGGIACWDGSSAEIESNTIESNTATWAAGIACWDSSPIIRSNVIRYNAADENGGGLECYGASSQPAIMDNTITGNSAPWGGGIYCKNSSSPTIENNTITDNQAPGDHGEGGGIYCVTSSPTISSNTITGNSAGDGGGGICSYDNSSPTIQDNAITGNSANWAGGICCSWTCSPTITHNEISGNYADVGGGIGCYDSSPTITNCLITHNESTNGGGIYCHYYSSPTITDNTISGNSASSDGGGIFCSDSSSPDISDNTISANAAGTHGGGIRCLTDCSPTITNCTINENSACFGGGIHCRESSPTAEDCAIADNTAVDDGGGIKAISLCELTILNCLVTGNEAGRTGGGICCCYNNWVTLTNCTFADNIARWPAVGGAIYKDGDTVSLTNCILWGDSPEEIKSVGSGTVTVTYSDVDQTGYAGSSGSISSDPEFRSIGLDDMPYDGYFLYHETDTTGSPCIDTGDPSDNPFGGASNSDYSTDPRNNASPLIDTNRVDMGYHYKYHGCTYIRLVSFTARPVGSRIVLDWETGAEMDNAGFVVCRAIARTSDYQQLSGLIPAQGTPTSGASYSFTDGNVEAGVSYDYWLVDFDTSGKWTAHGPASARLVALRVLPDASAPLESSLEGKEGRGWRSFNSPE